MGKLAESIPIIEPPFRSAEQAVRFAFAMEARDICKISSYFRNLRNKSNPSEMTAWDRAAQGAMILALVERHLEKNSRMVLMARYTVPASNQLSRRKNKSFLAVANYLRPRFTSVPIQYFVDVVRGWAGFRRYRTNAWWSKFLGLSERTLEYWCYGRRRRNHEGLLHVLTQIELDAFSRLNEVMEDSGLVRRRD